LHNGCAARLCHNGLSPVFSSANAINR
jgi:hypothetical protein